MHARQPPLAQRARGQAERSSAPFFLPLAASGGEPVFAGGNPCLSASRDWARNITDVAERTLAVVQPDGSSNVSLYSANSGGGSRIEFIDALGNRRFEERNALGELAASTDAGGLRIDYDYDATGNLLAARRDAGAGEIVSRMEREHGVRSCYLHRARGHVLFCASWLRRIGEWPDRYALSFPARCIT